MEISFENLLIVVAAGFAAPLALGLVPGLRLPSVVLEIVVGILIGPAVLGWVEVDEPVEVLALVGLAFLLFLAGLEIDLAALRGALLAGALLAFALSFDEIVVTTFTAGPGLQTLPLWIFQNLFRPNQSPIVNVAAAVLVLISVLPVYLANRLSGDTAGTTTK